MRNTNSSLLVSNYKRFNLFLAVAIGCILIYPVPFSPIASKHPVPSVFTKITGEESPSTGISRSFSAIVRGQFAQAKKLNAYSIPIFFFFFIQFVVRIGLFFSIKKNFSWIKALILADISFSAVSFFLVFKALIFFSCKLFFANIVR